MELHDLGMDVYEWRLQPTCMDELLDDLCVMLPLKRFITRFWMNSWAPRPLCVSLFHGLALKAFTDQKGRFFPHLEDKTSAQACDGEYVVSKRQRISQGLGGDHRELREEKTLSDVLDSLDHAMSNIRVFTYQRLDWLKRASSLSSSLSDNLIDPSKEQSFRTSNKLRAGSSNIAADQVAVIELLVPSIFRAVVSLHPAGSINPDAVAFFSPDEEGSYIHARGLSVFHVFRHVTEYADKALQHFLSMDSDASLSLILHWICSYQTLFTKICSKCGRLLMMDKSLALLLPPVHRSYTDINPSARPPNIADATTAHHIECSN